jgi:hypothetical protein
MREISCDTRRAGKAADGHVRRFLPAAADGALMAKSTQSRSQVPLTIFLAAKCGAIKMCALLGTKAAEAMMADNNYPTFRKGDTRGCSFSRRAGRRKREFALSLYYIQAFVKRFLAHTARKIFNALCCCVAGDNSKGSGM